MADSQGPRPTTSDRSGQPDMAAQRAFWNEWNIRYREDQPPDGPSLRRSEEVLKLLTSLQLANPRVLEVGCANGWLTQRISGHTPHLVGTDLADECIRIASAKYPHIKFVAGNFLDLKFEGFDVVVCVDSMASIADHATFVKGLVDALEPGGHLILTTQNPFVMSRRSTLAPWLRDRSATGPARVRCGHCSAPTSRSSGYTRCCRPVTAVSCVWQIPALPQV